MDKPDNKTKSVRTSTVKSSPKYTAPKQLKQLDQAYATGGNEGKNLKKSSSSNVISAKEPPSRRQDKKSQMRHGFSYADIGIEDNDKDFTSSSDSNKGKRVEVKEENKNSDA